MNGVPPKISAVPPKLPKPRRRWAQIIVWTTLAMVLFAGVIFFSDHSRPRGNQNRTFFGGPPQGGFRRPQSVVRPPLSPVPADLWRVEITLKPTDEDKLRSYSWNGWRGQSSDRPEVLATVREGGVTYTNVAMHLKGAAGSFRDYDDKPAVTLNFSKHGSGQKFHGYSKISLNNSVQDPSLLTEIICRELFESAGVPVARAGHATLLINGRDLGVYVYTEGYGKSFLKRYFKNVSGNLYDSGFCQDISGDLGVNSGEHPDDHSGLDRLKAAARGGDLATRWARLSKVLDTDRFISFLALEVMTCHWDGYGLNHNNYRLFHDLDSDRMVFIPHGMDQMFGIARSTPKSPILPGMRGMVASAVLSTREGRELYLARMDNLRTNIFNPERVTQRVRELSARVRPTLAAYDPARAAEHDRQVAYLCQRITWRAASISEQLDGPQPALSLSPAGSVKLTNWAPRISGKQPGTIRFETMKDGDKPILHITVADGGGAASWRTHVNLRQGEYHFQGRVKAIGEQNDGGLRLRISGGKDKWEQSHDGEWTSLESIIRVDESHRDVELVCEFKASNGEAWFDASSLTLVGAGPR